jgi:hypothetical protein
MSTIIVAQKNVDFVKSNFKSDANGYKEAYKALQEGDLNTTQTSTLKF